MRPRFRRSAAIFLVSSFFREVQKRSCFHRTKLQERSEQAKFFLPSYTGLPQRGQQPMISRSGAKSFWPSSEIPVYFLTSSRTISQIPSVKVSGSPSPLAIAVRFCSHSAVSMGEVSGSGSTVTRLIPSLVGIRDLPLRSTKPAATSFSMMAALVAGVPRPLRSASSGISSLPAVSMADRRVSSV